MELRIQLNLQWRIKMLKKHKGFTFPEILLTIGILGVVCALVISSIINDIQMADFKAKYKQAFQVATDAWDAGLANKEIVTRTGWYDWDNAVINFGVFKSHFSIAIDCSDGDCSKCWAPGENYWGIDHSGNPWNYGFVDSSGRAWLFNGSNDILVDINGSKGPNKFGRDRFCFESLTQSADGFNDPGLPSKIIPRGDYTNPNSNECPSGNCFYTTWLTQ